jgi:glutathione synthase/RimK-type ligase-like ATP-grasp enzyme
VSLNIVILTEDRYETPSKKNSYTNNILKEDYLLIDALKKLGFNVMRSSWSSKKFNWEVVDYAIFRTTWDYFERLEDFLRWINTYSRKIKFINSVDLIKWNLDKSYLQDFPKEVVVPSFFLKKDSVKSLKEISTQKGWKELIIKPSVSAAAWNTHRVSAENISEMELVFSNLKSSHKMIVQEFQKSVLTSGEISIMVFGGKYSHAVLKKSKKNDFRVQDDFGGTVYKYEPKKNEIDFAEKIVGMCPERPLYARVDIMLGKNGKILLSELEIIEPELWFRFCEKSADFLAKKIYESIIF